MRASLLLLLLLPLGSCPSLEGRPWRSDPGLRADLAALEDAPDLEVLLALDRLEERGDPALAPWLLGLQSDPDRGLPLRSRAAAALLALGFPQGQEFCLAILAAHLPGHEEESLKLGIPVSERMAFSRELALRPLVRRLREAGRPVPFYDVNQGAGDMARSAEALRRALGELPRPRPSCSRRALHSSIPPDPPEGWSPERWDRVRKACLAVFDSQG